MSNERVAEITEYFKSDVKAVWGVVTNNEDYAWRSDIRKIESLAGGKQWREYYDEKNYTTFTLVEKSEYSRYVFDMDSKMFAGRWTGFFYPAENGGTKVVFTERISIKNPVMRILAGLFWNLEKIQKTYMRDLKTRLGEN